MEASKSANDSLQVDISDALSERDRVRFTVHTKTTLSHFAKPVLSVVRQHEEFIWLHDCLEDNDQYAGYIIPPPPPRPDFDASREKLQRFGDGEANMTKEEFAKMKQELKAEYLAIFKKTVAMHEIFLQRLAAHEKFRYDNNFKIFLEYENELAVRCKSKKEKIAGSIQNIGRSLTDFVITTSQIAATTSASTSLLVGHASPSRQPNSTSRQILDPIEPNGNKSGSDPQQAGNSTNQSARNDSSNITDTIGDGKYNDSDDHLIKDEQYFEKERLFLALYHDSIRDTAIQADKVTHLQKAVADTYLYMSQQLIKLASIEVLPITSQTQDSSNYVRCALPSLTMPTQPLTSVRNPSKTSNNNPHTPETSSSVSYIQSSSSKQLSSDGLDDLDSDLSDEPGNSKRNSMAQSDNSILNGGKKATKLKKGCANDHNSKSLKQLLLYVSDYLEHAKKIETRIASDEDLKLTDTFLYYKRDTVAAQNLLVRRLRFMAEYESATKNLEKARQKGITQMQYADVIQKKAKENFISISRLAKQELIDYKQRRVMAFKKAFSDLVELELKQLRAHSQLIQSCLDACNGVTDGFDANKLGKNARAASSSGLNIEEGSPGTKLTPGGSSDQSEMTQQTSK